MFNSQTSGERQAGWGARYCFLSEPQFPDRQGTHLPGLHRDELGAVRSAVQEGSPGVVSGSRSTAKFMN